MLNNKVKAIVSVCESEHSPIWSNTLPESLSMKDFIGPETKNLRSQDLPKYYRLNGAIYIAERKYFQKQNGFIGELTKAYIMPKKITDKITYASYLRMLKYNWQFSQMLSRKSNGSIRNLMMKI